MEFEKQLSRLEEIVAQIEKGELSLEDSLRLFEEGMKISAECQERLSAAEQKVHILLGFDESERPRTEDFTASAGKIE